VCVCSRVCVCVFVAAEEPLSVKYNCAVNSANGSLFFPLHPLRHAQIHHPSFYAAAKGFITCIPKKIRICNCCKYIRLANARFAFVFSLLLPRDCTMGLRWKNQTDRLPRFLLLFKQPSPLKANFNLIACMLQCLRECVAVISGVCCSN